MSDVVLIRPGCTDFDDQKRIQGSLDLPLNTRGQEQLTAIVKQLGELNIDVLITSPCEPARSTATAIGEELGIPVKASDHLRNLDHGLWQGQLVDDVRRKYPKVFKQWQECPETICPPEGEMVSDAVDRIRKALGKPLKRKKTFGIVASEPLATLISCVVADKKFELPDQLCSGEKNALVEVLVRSSNGQGTSKTNGSDHQNGRPEKHAGVSVNGDGT